MTHRSAKSHMTLTKHSTGAIYHPLPRSAMVNMCTKFKKPSLTQSSMKTLKWGRVTKITLMPPSWVKL